MYLALKNALITAVLKAITLCGGKEKWLFR